MRFSAVIKRMIELSNRKKLVISVEVHAESADNDEYLNIIKINIHTKINIRLNVLEKQNKIPKKTATPLPPLNINHTG